MRKQNAKMVAEKAIVRDSPLKNVVSVVMARQFRIKLEYSWQMKCKNYEEVNIYN